MEPLAILGSFLFPPIGITLFLLAILLSYVSLFKSLPVGNIPLTSTQPMALKSVSNRGLVNLVHGVFDVQI